MTTAKKIKSEHRTEAVKQEINFDELYKLHFPTIKAFILKNSGNADDARDIFQETMIVLIDKINKPGFVLSSSLGTFLFAISKNVWFTRLREKGKMIVSETFEDISDADDDKSELIDEKLSGWLNQISHRCRQIIQSLFFLSEPMIQLAARMGWKNRHTADNQKYKCIQQLKKVSNR